MFGSPTAPIRTALEALARSFDRAALSGEEAVAVVHDLGVIRKLADALAGQVALRVEETGAHRRYCDRTAAVTVAKAFGIEAGEAQRIVETARKVCGSAATEASVRAGALSVREAELVADAVSVAPGSERRMLSAARQGLRCLKDEAARVRAEVEDPAARAARQRRDRSLSWWTDPDGMVNGRLRLPAEVGGPIMGWFDEATRRVFRERSRGDADQHEPHAAYAADVFVELVRRNAWPTTEPTDDGRAADGGSLVGPELDAAGAAGRPVDLGFSHTVHVVIDHATLARGECVEGERCEIPGVGPVSVTWARELLGDAFVTAVIKKGVDIATVAHLGRHIPAELRTALVVSGRECDIDGCGIRGYLEIDHDHEHAKGGLTSWHNLGWLCATHHHLKTSGWTLSPRDPTTRKRTIHPPATGVGHRRRRPHAA